MRVWFQDLDPRLGRLASPRGGLGGAAAGGSEPPDAFHRLLPALALCLVCSTSTGLARGYLHADERRVGGAL